MPVIPEPCAPGGGGPITVEGCCSPSLATAPLCRADGRPILLVLRSACADCGGTAADPEVAGWIDPASGAFTPGPPPDDAGPCEADDCASVSLLRLCDHTPDGECIPFIRHLVHDCDGQVIASTDTEPDGTTPYAVQGEVVDCDDCPCGPCTKVVPLCDYLGPGLEPVVPFLRHLTYDCATGQVQEQTDTLTDNTTPYTPIGEVGECGQCRPTPMCPQLLGYTGPDVWQMPDGTESVSITVACGPLTITDCAGNATVVNECGSSFQWSAPPSECAPGRLCGPLSVELDEGAQAYIQFLAPCDMGDDS